MTRDTPTLEQQQAIDARNHDVLCTAGAGTGKTTVLVDVYVESLIDSIHKDPEGSHLESIVAFTFTERAAQQLRHRIRLELARKAEEISGEDDDLSARLKRYSREIEGARISTIHGFCRRLLATHPVAAGLDPQFKVLDESAAARLESLAVPRAFDRLLTDQDSAAREQAIGLFAANAEKTLVSALKSAFEQARALGVESAWPEIPEPDHEEFAHALEQLNETAQALLEVADDTFTNASTRNTARRALETASSLDEESSLAADDLGIELKPAAQRSENNTDLIASYLVAMEAFEALRPSERAYRARGTYAAFLRLIEGFSEEYSALKDARSALDFEDLQTRAIALLESSGIIAEEVTGGISHVLVDEFQDTNWSQYRLIELLCAGGAHRFEVGDSLQSIYGFRGANVEIIERESGLFADAPDDRATIEPLRGNFRSTPSLIAGVNGLGKALFESLDEANDSGLVTTEYEDLTVGREWEEQPRPGVEFLFTKTMQTDPWGQARDVDGKVVSETGLRLPEDGKSSPSRVAEARVLARRIAALVEAGETTASEVVVLLRAFGHVDTYEMALADLGLDPYVVGGRGYWESQEIRDLVCLLEVIANPLDDAALFGALASPACSASTDTLWCLRHAAGKGRRSLRIKHALDALVSDVPSDWLNEAWEGIRDGDGDETSRPDPSLLDSIPPEEHSRLIEFWTSIGELRQRAGQLGLAETIETTVTSTGYDLATLMRDRGEQRWANVRKLIRLARDLEASDGVDLRGLLLYIESEKQREREATATTVPEDHDGVRLMTVHSAKGLEFDTVAVADLGRQLKASGYPALIERDSDGRVQFGLKLHDSQYGRNVAFLDHEVLNSHAKAREIEEELRIAHVAFTRAEKRLLVSGTFNWTSKGITHLSSTNSIANRLVAMVDDLKPESKDEDGEVYESYVSEVELFEDPVPRQDLDTDCQVGPSRLEWTFPTIDAGLALNPGASAGMSAESEKETIELPPDSLPSAPPSSASELSFTALASYEKCGLRFLAEYEIGMRPDDSELGSSRPGDDEFDLPSTSGNDTTESLRARRFGIGNAVHSLLEWSARNRWQPPGTDRVTASIERETLEATGDRVEKAGNMVSAWLGSELLADLKERRLSFRPEESFLLPVGGSIFRGFIDLLATDVGSGCLELIDYKTNSLSSRSPTEIMRDYELQRMIYAVAASGLSQEIRTHYVFLESPDDVQTETFGPSELADARRRIEQSVDAIAQRRFEPTSSPWKGLCQDCPIWRTCPHDYESKRRADPEPSLTP